MGLLGDCPERGGGCWVSAGHGGDKIRASVGLPFEYRVGHHFALFATIRHFNAKEKERRHGCNCCDN